jgi:hypothetical protein
MAEIRTWHLSDEEIPAAVAKLQKINERAAKNGLDGRYAWKLGEERHTPVFDDEGARLVIDGIPHRIEKGQPVPCALIGWKHERELVVSGDAPKLAGWTFVARLTWDGGVLVTRCTPEFEGRIDDSQIREGACDHCHTDRPRYDCYLLQGTDGQRVQVGSSCVKDFLGIDFRPGFISYGDDLDQIEHDVAGTRTYVDADALSVLSWAASICSQTGWASREKAEAEYRTPSGETLRNVLFGWTQRAREDRAKYAATDEHRAEAEKVLAWARELEPGNSEYLANVERVAALNFVTERNVAILGSAVASYHREMNLIAERAARPVSQWIGQPKQRLDLALTVKGDTAIDGDWGVTHLYTMVDAAGNVCKWFSSRSQNWQIGQEVQVKATVKGHETYRDVKQTVITRCAEVIQPEPDFEAEVS